MRHLRTYRAIRLILREGSIRKAAEILAISPSALNRSILAFEEELGVELFDRLPGGVVPSVAGELLFRHLDEHLSRMDDFVSLVSEMKGGAAGTLRLSVSGDLVDTVLPGALGRFRVAYGGVAVEVVEIDSAAALMARDVDLALVTRPETEAGIEVVLSHPLAVAGAVAENHPKSGGRLTLSEIADHALILPREGTGLRAALDGALRKARIVPRQSHIVPVGALGLVAGPVPDLRPFLVAPGATAGPKVELSALRVPAVQLTVLRRNAGVLPRAAALFLAVLHRGLDA